MSLILNTDTKPDLCAKTSGFGKDKLTLGEYSIGQQDFCELVMYVLTNTSLQDDDPRLKLIERIKGLEVVSGFNSYDKRLEEKGWRK